MAQAFALAEVMNLFSSSMPVFGHKRPQLCFARCHFHQQTWLLKRRHKDSCWSGRVGIVEIEELCCRKTRMMPQYVRTWHKGMAHRHSCLVRGFVEGIATHHQ